ncbi:hypothetical protein GCM10027271_08260 [Saccharopolyspora gloriosae]
MRRNGLVAGEGRLGIMAAKKGRSGVATLINGAGFLLAVILVLHIVLVLFHLPSENGLADSVRGAAEPLALFFPGLIQTTNAQLQLLFDYGLAAAFWVLVASLLARVFG